MLLLTTKSTKKHKQNNQKGRCVTTNMCTEIYNCPEYHEEKNRNYKGKDTTDATK